MSRPVECECYDMFTCGHCARKIKMRYQKVRKWHRWFAWCPVDLDGRTVWLKTIERRAIHICSWYGATQWGYRWPT